MDKFDISYFLKNCFRLYKTRYLIMRKIYLCYITCNDGFRSESQPGQEHLHLFRCRVLRFIQNDKRVIQSSPPHKCQRSYFYDSLVNEGRRLVKINHVKKSIIERPEIWVNLFGKVAGQKSEPLTSFNSRPCQNNPIDFLIKKRRDSHGHSKVCFACSRRTYCKDNIVASDQINIYFLRNALGSDGALF